MKRLLIVLAIAALAITLAGPPAPEAASWKTRCVYDSLGSAGITGAADTVQLTNWELNAGGYVAFYYATLSIANTGTAPNLNFKYKLRQSDGEPTWVQAYYYPSGSGGATATALNSSAAVWGYVGLQVGLSAVPTPMVGGTLYLIITKNNWSTGTLSLWSWTRQE